MDLEDIKNTSEYRHAVFHLVLDCILVAISGEILISFMISLLMGIVTFDSKDIIGVVVFGLIFIAALTFLIIFSVNLARMHKYCESYRVIKAVIIGSQGWSELLIPIVSYRIQCFDDKSINLTVIDYLFFRSRQCSANILDDFDVWYCAKTKHALLKRRQT